MSDPFAEYRHIARDFEVDALALVPGPNFVRATGQAFMSHERPFLLLIGVGGDDAAIVPTLELGSWAQVGFEGALHDWRDQDGYAAAFAALAASHPIGSLAVEGQVMRVFVHHALKAALPDLVITDAESAISGLRVIKTEAEIAALRTAIDISERALHRTLDQLRAGQSEAQIERMLIESLFSEGAEDLAFFPIVTAAENSARPHGKARSDYAVQAGDALLFDFGARFGGFAADLTRTVFVGHATDEGRAVYETVLAAAAAGHDLAAPGVTAHELDDAVSAVLETSPFADRIRTKTGHGLGRDVHEAPYIIRGNHVPLAAGMVFTIEPGLYKEEAFGVRIEDDVLITERGCQSLSCFPKNLMIVGR